MQYILLLTYRRTAVPDENRTDRIVITCTPDEKTRYKAMCEALDPPEKFSSHAYKVLIEGELALYEDCKA
jgi:hypothetical protein